MPLRIILSENFKREVKIVDERVYLLSVYDKSEQENISDKRLQFILKEAGLLP